MDLNTNKSNKTIKIYYIVINIDIIYRYSQSKNTNLFFPFLDLMQSRLDLAKQLGANETLLIKKDDVEEKTVQKIIELFGEEPDKTIDACGAESSIRLAIFVSFFFSKNSKNIRIILLYQLLIK